MKTTLKHKKTSYPENPIILKILVQKNNIETQKDLLAWKSCNLVNPGSENNIETQKDLLS